MKVRGKIIRLYGQKAKMHDASAHREYYVRVSESDYRLLCDAHRDWVDVTVEISDHGFDKVVR